MMNDKNIMKKFISIFKLSKGQWCFGFHISHERYNNFDGGSDFELYLLISLFKYQISIGKLI